MKCPFCRKILQGPRWGRSGAIRDTGGPEAMSDVFWVTCLGKSDDPPCDFRALLTPQEFAMFERRTFPTHSWLKKTDKLCPKCDKNKKVFLRIRDGQKWLLCEDWFHKDGTCEYRQKL